MEIIDYENSPASVPILIGDNGDIPRVEETYQVFGKQYGKEYRNTHRAEVVRVTDAGVLLFGHVEDDLLILDHGYAPGAWMEFKRGI